MSAATERDGDDPDRTVLVELSRTLVQASEDPGRSELAAGMRFGRYRLLQPLGSGGMGVVYLAEQTEPVHRQVAIKVMAQRRVDGEHLARFELERQALARMNHPGIAQILDAGTTPEGWPYFVMEHVEGRTLDEWLNRDQPDLRTRLALLREACLALGHAHQKGVLHCDLKPSNLLVTHIDGQPRVKLIDFGIARAVDAGGPSGSAGTPAYMSPEQVADGDDLDTRSDVFSLGVLLYESLCRKRFRPWADGADLARARERIETERDSVPDCNLRTPRSGLRRRELIAICRHALAHEREQRYESPHALAAEIGRWLDHEPVEAHGRGPGYRLRCFVRRHAAISATTAAALMITFVLLWRLALQLEETRRERDTAEQITDLLLDTFHTADPYLHPSGNLSVRDLLRSGGARIRDKTLEPRVRQRVLATLAGVQHRLELYEDAAETWSLARELADPAALSTADRDELDLQYARALYDAERWQDARDLVAALIARATGQDQPHLLARVLGLQAEIASYTGDLETGLSALAAFRPLLDRIDDDEIRILWYRTHARLDDDRNDLDSATDSLEQALALARRTWGEHDLRSLDILSDLALAIGRSGDHVRDEQLRREVASATEAIWGEDSPGLAIALDNLGVAVRRRGDEDALREAESLSRRALGILHNRLGPGATNTAIAANNLATVLAAQGQLDEALHFHAEAVRVLDDALGTGHRNTAIARHNQARTLLQAGRLDEAEDLLDRSGPVLRETLGERHPRHAAWLLTQAELLAARGEQEAARALLETADEVLATELPTGAEEQRRAQQLRARLGQGAPIPAAAVPAR